MTVSSITWLWRRKADVMDRRQRLRKQDKEGAGRPSLCRRSAISVKQHADTITALFNATPQQQQQEFLVAAHNFKTKKKCVAIWAGLGHPSSGRRESNWNLTFRALTPSLTGTDMNRSGWQIVCIRPVPGWSLWLCLGFKHTPLTFRRKVSFCVHYGSLSRRSVEDANCHHRRLFHLTNTRARRPRLFAFSDTVNIWLGEDECLLTDATRVKSGTFVILDLFHQKHCSSSSKKKITIQNSSVSLHVLEYLKGEEKTTTQPPLKLPLW